MEQGIGGGPVLSGAHIRDMAFIGIKHPFTKGIEQDIGSKSRGEHHGAPLEGRVLGFFQASQFDFAVSGKCHIEGTDKRSQPDDQIIASQLVAQEETD